MNDVSPLDISAWPVGGGEMGALIRAFDWSKTPLGPIETWPQSLKTAVDLLLPGGFPMVALWGPDLIQIYNDGYRALMGVKHPAGLGQPTRECWPEAWHVDEPIYNRAWAGETLTFEDKPYPITRHGAPADAWFTLSYSPLRDEGGTIAGVLVTLFETTDRVLAERTLRESEARLAADLAGMRRLYDLHARLASETDLRRALDEIVGAANEFLGTDRGCVQLVSDDGERLEMFAFRGYDPRDRFIQRFLHESSKPACDAARRDRPRLVIEDVATFPGLQGTVDGDVALADDIRATQSTPMISRKGDLVGVLSNQFRRPHRPADDELRLIDLLAWTGADFVERHRASAALRESEARFRLIVENARDYAIFTLDSEGRIDGWPPGAAAVFGWTEAEAIGQPMAMTFVPEDREGGEPERELALARETGVAPDVRWHLRKDGSRVFIEGTTRSLSDSGGALRGFLKIGQDVTRRREIEQALRKSEALFRTLATTVPQLVFLSRPDGARTWGSPQWIEHTGLDFEQSLDFGWLEAIHPDDRAATLQGWAEAAASGQYYAEHRVRGGPDRAYRWYQTRARPLHAEDPAGSEWVGAMTDIHDLRQLQEQQRVMVTELQHRTRNLLGVVRAIAHQTRVASGSLEIFATRFDERLGALSRVQGLLSRSKRQRIPIGALVRMELDALGARALGDRVTVGGPEVALPNSAAQTLALALYELATNARKYGALAGERGRLRVTWRIGQSDDRPCLSLEWVEDDVDRQGMRPARRGYGRELIERALPYSLGAKTRFELNETGVRCRIDLPLDPVP